MKHLRNLISANLITTTMGILSGIILARMLPVAERGILAEIFLWTSLITSFFSDTLREYEISRTKDDHNINEKIIIVFSSLSITLIVSVLYFLNKSSHIWYAVIFSPINILTTIYLAKVQTNSQFEKFSLYSTLIPVSYTVSLLTLFFIGNVTTNSILITNVIMNFMLLLVLFKVEKKPYTEAMIDYKKIYIIIISIIAISLNNQADKILISILYDEKIMGLFIVAITISFTPISVMGNALANYASINIKKNPHKTLAIKKTILLFITSSTIIGVFIYVISPYIIPSIFGESYKASSELVPVCLVLAIAVNLKNIMNSFLRGLGENKQINKIQTYSLIITFLSILFSYEYEIKESSSILLLTIFQSIIVIIFISKTFSIAKNHEHK